MINDSKTQYGTLSKVLHWGMALLIGWQLMKFGDRIADGEHWVGQTLVPWHVSIGSLLLVLIVARLIWAASQRKHRPQHDPQTARLVKAGHGLLYAGMMVMLGGGYGVNAFGLQIIAKGEELGWAATLGSLHSPLAWALTVLIVGHIGMALLHHFRGKDVLKRMV
jgi:cytochrome b561